MTGAVYERIVCLWQGYILVATFRGRDFLEKTIVIQLAKRIRDFIKPKGSFRVHKKS
jgi:hypothetical protein